MKSLNFIDSWIVSLNFRKFSCLRFETYGTKFVEQV